MKNSNGLFVAAAGAVLVACGGQAPAPSATPVVNADPHCIAVADSLLRATAPDALPLSKPVGRSRIPRPPVDAQPNSIVHATFLVQPDRHADLGSIKTIGTGDNAYKRDVIDLLRTELFDVPAVDGCPVWGRGDLQTMITRGRPPTGRAAVTQ